MKLSVRPVDLELDRKELLELLQRNLSFRDHATRFDWQYYDNPGGRAWSWFVLDGSKNRAVGVATVFPRNFWIDGTVARGGQVGDFAVDAAYRSLGPALRLQRATFGPVDEGILRFCYDCPPHDRGMAPFHRLGLPPVFRATRFRRLLKADSLVRRRFPASVTLRASATLLLNSVLWAQSRIRARQKELVLDVHEGPFGDEFDELEIRHERKGIVRVCRGAKELNWKYRLDPDTSYRVTTVRRRGELLGFAVYSEVGSGIRLDDVVATSEQARLCLLLGVCETARESGKECVDTWAVAGSREASVARSAGFSARDLGDRFVVYPANGVIGGVESDSIQWHF